MMDVVVEMVTDWLSKEQGAGEKKRGWKIFLGHRGREPEGEKKIARGKKKEQEKATGNLTRLLGEDCIQTSSATSIFWLIF